MLKSGIAFLIIIFLNSLMPQRGTIDVQGHRGCRGLMPENTIPAFLKAMELGVSTLEMDVVISSDLQVVVSHEPYFRAPISLDPSGNPVLKKDEMKHNIYLMTYDSIRQYDVGTLPDPSHPSRQAISTPKPLLVDVVEAVRLFCEEHEKPLPIFNIEIKRTAQYDDIFHPDGSTFVNLVIGQIEELNIAEHTIVQSFDLESLKLVRERMPDLPLALLVANQKSAEENVEDLGFTPEVYSSYFRLVNNETIQYCRKKGIKVIPWTVNETADIRKMLDLGVDGIISDYPDRVINMQ